MDLIETGSEYRHPWELSRNDCLLKAILPYVNTTKTIADIGCGDLFFSENLATTLAGHFNGTIYAIDTGFANTENTVKTTHKNITILDDINKLEDNSIDIAILMDVLEHVENQNEFLTKLSEKLSADARVFITVPAFQHLFSAHDTFLKHHRRYNKKSLSAVLTDNGFIIDSLFYFYSILYIPRLLQFIATRLIKSDKMAGNITSWKKDENAPQTRLIRTLLNLDFQINKTLGRLSLFGLSLFAMCRM